MNNDMKLNELRDELDYIDDQIASLILKRLEQSSIIGKIKKEMSVSTYTPVREREILQRIISSVNNDELKIHVKRIFERIIDESRAVQRKIK